MYFIYLIYLMSFINIISISISISIESPSNQLYKVSIAIQLFSASRFFHWNFICVFFVFFIFFIMYNNNNNFIANCVSRLSIQAFYFWLHLCNQLTPDSARIIIMFLTRNLKKKKNIQNKNWFFFSPSFLRFVYSFRVSNNKELTNSRHHVFVRVFVFMTTKF